MTAKKVEKKEIEPEEKAIARSSEPAPTPQAEATPEDPATTVVQGRPAQGSVVVCPICSGQFVLKT